MDLLERLIYFGIGCGIGFILGYISKGLREVQMRLDERDEVGKINWELLSRFALGLVVALSAYAAFVTQDTSNDLKDNFTQDKISRCEAGVDSRNVQRDTVQAIWELSVSVLARDPALPPLTEAEIIGTNNFINQVNKFRREQFKAIVPSETCLDLVEDDSVPPPTPDYPLVKTKRN